MEFNGDQNIESQNTIIAERSCEFKKLLSYFENISANSKKSTPSFVVKEKTNIIEPKPVVKRNQKKVTFDLSKNETFVYESEESILQRIKNESTQKENRTITTENIIVPLQFEINNEPEEKMFDFKEIRHFWANLCK